MVDCYHYYFTYGKQGERREEARNIEVNKNTYFYCFNTFFSVRNVTNRIERDEKEKQ